VRRIFELCAARRASTASRKTLNAEGALSPRSQQGRPRSCAPSAVRGLLHRGLSRGLVTYNKTAKRNRWHEAADRQRRRSFVT
jgi:hypothetical protein